jgi:hypothetical protein
MFSDRTKLVRGVLGFLAGCAVLGFFLGMKGAMPRNVDPEMDQAPLATTQSGVIVEAMAQENTAPLPLEEKIEEETVEEKAEEAKPAPTVEAPRPEPVPAAAPKEEAPDPVGDLLQPPPPAATPPPADLY